MTRKEALELFAILAAAYPKEPMTEPQIALYVTLLSPYSGDAVRDAVLMHIQESPWFPKVSDLVTRLTEGYTADVDQAWREVMAQVRAVGYYGTPTWSSGALAEAVEAIGWQALCTSTHLDVERAYFAKFLHLAQRRTQTAALRHGLDAALQQRGLSLGSVGRVLKLVPTQQEDTP